MEIFHVSAFFYEIFSLASFGKLQALQLPGLPMEGVSVLVGNGVRAVARALVERSGAAGEVFARSGTGRPFAVRAQQARIAAADFTGGRIGIDLLCALDSAAKEIERAIRFFLARVGDLVLIVLGDG